MKRELRWRLAPMYAACHSWSMPIWGWPIHIRSHYTHELYSSADASRSRRLWHHLSRPAVAPRKTRKKRILSQHAVWLVGINETNSHMRPLLHAWNTDASSLWMPMPSLITDADSSLQKKQKDCLSTKNSVSQQCTENFFCTLFNCVLYTALGLT
jgi:hypothetical protein